MREGKYVCIITMRIITYEVLKAANKCSSVVTAEEHLLVSALGSAVLEALMSKLSVKFVMF